LDSNLSSRSELNHLEGTEKIVPLLKLAYSLYSTDPSEMRACIEEALGLSRRFSCDQYLVKCYNLYSIYHGVTGDYHKALEYAFKTLEYDQEKMEPEALSSRYTNISIIYGRLRDHENAARYAELALEQVVQTGNLRQKALILNNLGVASEGIEDSHRALECYLESAEILEESGPPDQFALTLVNVGQQYKRLDFPQKAEQYMSRALDAARAGEMDYVSAAAMLELAELYTGTDHDAFEVRDLLDKVLLIAETMKDTDFIIRTHLTTSKCFETLGDFSGALAAYKRYAELKEEVMDSEKVMAVARLENEFEFQKKEKEAEIYRLRNVELAKARDDAQAADRAKSDFLAMMSHEIRTPINVIMGMMELALRTEMTHQQRGYLSKCTVASRALLELINDILDYSRIEADMVEYESIVFSPAQLVRETASIFESMAEEKRVQLTISVDGSLPPRIEGDSGRVGQVLRNLLSNAVKFTEKGSIEVSAEQGDTSEERAEIKFTVRDTGPGIAVDVADQLFEPFVQASSSTSRTHGGSGLGLAICRRLMEGMEGSVEVESTPGKGSTFTATAPFRIVSLDDDELPEEQPVLNRIDGARILIVEDMEASREIGRLFLEALGAEVYEASDGYEALEAWEGLAPDLILMDLQMPGIDGIETTTRIREMGYEKPVIAATAHVLSTQKEFCLQAGLNDVVTKPFSLQDLQRVLTRWL